MLPAELERVLIVRPDGLGDLVLALPVAQVLKTASPGVSVGMLVSTYNRGVLDYTPHVDHHLLHDGDAGLKNARELAIELREARYDAIVILRPELRASYAAWRARIPVRIGTSRRAYSVFLNRPVSNPRRYSGLHETTLNVNLLRPLGIAEHREPVAPRMVADPDPRVLAKFGVPSGDPYVVVHLGSKGTAANWPAGRYLQLIEQLSRRLPVVTTGQHMTPAGIPSGAIDVTRRTTFGELIQLLRQSRLVVSGGTGPLHVAAALGTPVIAFYPRHVHRGPHRWGPCGARATIFMPEEGSHAECDLRADGSCECMETIGVQEVLSAIEREVAADT